MIISIDHGNKQIKTLNRTFTSGLLERDSKPAFGEDILCYEGKWSNGKSSGVESYSVKPCCV